MEVDAEVYYWSSSGMVQSGFGCQAGNAYVERRTAERLLEEAHARGRQQERDDYAARSRGDEHA